MSIKANFWDKRSKKYDESVRRHDPIFLKTIERSKILLRETDTVLDFGCASGEYGVEIAPYIRHLDGIDQSKGMIELANKKIQANLSEKIRFYQTNIFDKELHHSSYSAVLAFSIFHLLEDIPKALGQIQKLLTTNGLLISETPCLGNRNWIFQNFVKFAQKVGMVPPIQRLTFTELESLFSDSGFEVIESKIWDEKNAVQWIVGRKK